MKILVCGLPRQGKTTLAEQLAVYCAGVHFNADYIRQHINKDLGFSLEDRIEHATRMGILSSIVAKNDIPAIADFVCPTKATREAFGYTDFTIWVHTGQENPYADTQQMFEPLAKNDYDLLITNWNYSIPEIWQSIKMK